MAVKCVVWDLDNTVWDGILLEDSEVSLRPSVPGILKKLDDAASCTRLPAATIATLPAPSCGSLVSRTTFSIPDQLEFEAASVAQIAKDLNLALDAFAFVDDQPFEREDVSFSHPGVLTLDAACLDEILHRPEFNPRSSPRILAAATDVPSRHPPQQRGASSWGRKRSSSPLWE